MNELVLTGFKHNKGLLEHELVPNSDSGNVVRSIGCYCILDCVALSFISSSIPIDDVIASKDLHINTRLLDGLQLKIVSVKTRLEEKKHTTKAV